MPIAGRIANPCSYSATGIRRVWLALHGDITDWLYTDSDLQTVTSVSGSANWLEFVCEAATFTETANGITYSQVVTLAFPRPTTGKRKALESLLGQRIACVIEDRNLQTWIIGQEYGLLASLASSATNEQTTTVQLTGQERFSRRGILLEALTISSGLILDGCACDATSGSSFRLGMVTLEEWPTDLTPYSDLPIL